MQQHIHKTLTAGYSFKSRVSWLILNTALVDTEGASDAIVYQRKLFLVIIEVMGKSLWFWRRDNGAR
jgi:hypothetical protein